MPGPTDRYLKQWNAKLDDYLTDLRMEKWVKENLGGDQCE